MEEKLINQLVEALDAAHKHLQYCGYGDSWEREGHEVLDKQIVKALEKGNQFLKPKTKAHATKHRNQKN